MSDYRDVQAEFATRFDGRRSERFYIKGLNFMTPDVLGFVRHHDGDSAEVSTGMWREQRQFGVTFARVNDVPDPRDASFDTLAAVDAYLAGAS